MRDIYSDSAHVVYEFEIKIRDTRSQAIIYLGSMKGTNSVIARLVPGGLLWFSDDVKADVSDGTWHKVSAVYDYLSHTADIYLDGSVIIADKAVGSGIGTGSDIKHLRFHVYNSDDGSENIDFLIDNVYVYDSDKPLDKIGEHVRIMDIKSEATVFDSEEDEKALLNGFYAIHARSGLVSANGNKTALSSVMLGQDGNAYADSAELDSALGLKSGLSGSVSLSDYASACGLVISKDSSTKANDGLCVLGTRSFKFPTDEEMLESLNNYTFYKRPAADELKDAYSRSSLSGVHPRIHATAEDFERIRNESVSDPYIQKWTAALIAKADAILKTNAVKYELRDGVRLLYVSRDVLENMYTLGFAYQITGNTKYSDRAYKDLYAVCADFADWHPTHALDTGEMAAAVAIGYDWMYDAFSPEERRIIEKGMYSNGFYYLGMSYQTTGGSMGNSAVHTSNHNAVINSAAILAALAMFDAYPDESVYILSNALRSHEYYLWHFAPDGLWHEGASYWELTTQYLTKAITSLQTVFGTDFGLSDTEGFSNTLSYILNVQSPQGVYAYSDCMPLSEIYTPEMLWMADYYDKPQITKFIYEQSGGNMSTGEDYALCMLWCNTHDINTQQAFDLPLDAIYPGGGLLTSRSSWENTKSYLGIHAGYSVEDHSQLDTGSFIFDYDGVRWATDLGMGNYNSSQNAYWDGADADGLKWKLFMCRAESHNTIVVSPSDDADHVVSTDAFAALNLVDSDADSLIATVDMTPVLHDVSSAKRGFFYTDNKSSLVVRDEITTGSVFKKDIYWFMMTDADGVVSGNTITLTKNGKKLDVEFVTDGDAMVSFAPAAPLSGDYEASGRIPSVNRITIKVSARWSANITVKLTPHGVQGTPLSDYNKSISQWKLN